jgi:hypothetical protein
LELVTLHYDLPLSHQPTIIGHYIQTLAITHDTEKY